MADAAANTRNPFLKARITQGENAARATLGLGAKPANPYASNPNYVVNQATGMVAPKLSQPSSGGISTYTDPSGRTRNIWSGIGVGAEGQPIGYMPMGASRPPPVSGDMQWSQRGIGWELSPNENYYRNFGYGQGGTPADFQTGPFNQYRNQFFQNQGQQQGQQPQQPTFPQAQPRAPQGMVPQGMSPQGGMQGAPQQGMNPLMMMNPFGMMNPFMGMGGMGGYNPMSMYNPMGFQGSGMMPSPFGQYGMGTPFMPTPLFGQYMPQFAMNPFGGQQPLPFQSPMNRWF